VRPYILLVFTVLAQFISKRRPRFRILHFSRPGRPTDSHSFAEPKTRCPDDSSRAGFLFTMLLFPPTNLFETWRIGPLSEFVRLHSAFVLPCRSDMLSFPVFPPGHENRGSPPKFSLFRPQLSPIPLCAWLSVRPLSRKCPDFISSLALLLSEFLSPLPPRSKLAVPRWRVPPPPPERIFLATGTLLYSESSFPPWAERGLCLFTKVQLLALRRETKAVGQHFFLCPPRTH